MEIRLEKRYPQSRIEDVTDAFMRGYQQGMENKLTGEWEYRYVEDGSPFFRKRYYCSACGDWTSHGKSRFCPNCGARMNK